MSSHPPWLYNEMMQVGADYSDEAEVAEYDSRMRKLRDIREEIDEIITFLGLEKRKTVLEVGTGTGEFAIAASGYYDKVIAVDISRAMLNYARKKALGLGIKNIKFMQGGFLTYLHEGEPLDAAVTELALHHLPDFWKQVALLRISQMLRPGGKLYLMDMVYSFDLTDYEGSLDRYIAEREKDGGSDTALHVTAHIQKEFSTFGWIMEGMIKRAGFDINSAEYRAGFIAKYLCTKK
ncbi:MAG TPA: methyltransferase domain-containing protein [Methanotrichaceae archaeon]|nr:methyltransferase domain-containing protein [Methanotrichaceae archaeon]